MTFPPTVGVLRSGAGGTGFFVEDDLVVTAGHVLQAAPAPLDPDDYRVVLADGTTLHVKAVRSLPGWATGAHPSADMGVLRVKTKRAALVVPVRIDPQAAHLAVVVGGPNEQQYPGTVTRVAGGTSSDMLSSSDLAFPRGVSGGPIVDANHTALGVATRSTPKPKPGVLVGLPFLNETLGWLRNNCP